MNEIKDLINIAREGGIIEHGNAVTGYNRLLDADTPASYTEYRPRECDATTKAMLRIAQESGKVIQTRHRSSVWRDCNFKLKFTDPLENYRVKPEGVASAEAPKDRNADLKAAYARGETIEYLHRGVWKRCGGKPGWYSGQEYRIEPKEDPYAEVKAAHADGELEVKDTSGVWYQWRLSNTPCWNSPADCYRRKPKADPYAEAKEAYKDGELEVLDFKGTWKPWTFTCSPQWDCPPKYYRRKSNELKVECALDKHSKGFVAACDNVISFNRLDTAESDPHKAVREAFKKGAKIEWRGRDGTPWSPCRLPLWSAHLQYRVLEEINTTNPVSNLLEKKPEKKYFVAVAKEMQYGIYKVHPTKYDSLQEFEKTGGKKGAFLCTTEKTTTDPARVLFKLLSSAEDAFVMTHHEYDSRDDFEKNNSGYVVAYWVVPPEADPYAEFKKAINDGKRIEVLHRSGKRYIICSPLWTRPPADYRVYDKHREYKEMHANGTKLEWRNAALRTDWADVHIPGWNEDSEYRVKKVEVEPIAKVNPYSELQAAVAGGKQIEVKDFEGNWFLFRNATHLRWDSPVSDYRVYDVNREFKEAFSRGEPIEFMCKVPNSYGWLTVQKPSWGDNYIYRLARTTAEASTYKVLYRGPEHKLMISQNGYYSKEHFEALMRSIGGRVAIALLSDEKPVGNSLRVLRRLTDGELMPTVGRYDNLDSFNSINKGATFVAWILD